MKQLIKKSFKKKIIGTSIKSPPAKGTFFLLENDWWISPEKLENIPLFFKTNDKINTSSK